MEQLQQDGTRRTARGYPAHLARVPRRLIAIGLISLVVAACGGDGAMTGAGNGSDAPADIPTEGAPVLDCVRDGYPCSFDEVSLPVIERSLALSEEVAGQLEDGADIEQVAADLSAQGDVVDVTVDGPVLGFRLDGGRPMIVDVTGDQELLPDTTEASVQGPVQADVSGTVQDGMQKLHAVRTAPRDKLTRGDDVQRRALVLSPFYYEKDFANAGEFAAYYLAAVPGYEGNVTYLATTDEFDPQVTVDILTQLDEYDVIHIDTHGGTLCKKKEALLDPSKGKDKQKCENGVTDFLVQRFHGTAADLQGIAHPGVIHYRGSKHQSIAVTADFFRHYYPEGLSDRLFVLGACNTFRSDMADAVAGDRGIFVSWDGYTDYFLVRNTSVSLIESLGLGLTVGESYARMPTFTPGNPESLGVLQQTGRRAGGDLRIRDLISVHDNLTGKPVTNTSGIEVKEVPGDGQNDNLDLEFTIDGITPEQLANFYVNLVINDQVIGHLDVQQSGVQVDQFRYRVSTPVPLPFDAQEGQSLNVDFWIPLPDLGEDHFVAGPKVNENDVPQVGGEWVLASVATQARTDDVTIKSASVVFEIEPDDDPEGRYHYFRVKSGNVRIQREYEDALGCRFIIDYTIDIPAGAANNYLKFDAGSATPILDGFGSAASQTVQATGSCGDTANVSVGGVYFVADEIAVYGDSVLGGYNDGAAFPTVIEWNLTRTL